MGRTFDVFGVLIGGLVCGASFTLVALLLAGIFR